MYISTFWPGITAEKLYFDPQFHLVGEKKLWLKKLTRNFSSWAGFCLTPPMTLSASPHLAP